MKYSSEIGSKTYYDYALCNLSAWYLIKGAFAQSYSVAEEAYESSTRRGDAVCVAKSTPLLSLQLLLTNNVGEAIRLLEKAKKTLDVGYGMQDLPLEMIVSALIGLGFVYKGDFRLAKEHMEYSLSISRKIGDSSDYLTYMGYTALAEGYITTAVCDPNQGKQLLLK